MSKVKHIKLKLVPIKFKELKVGSPIYDIASGIVHVYDINKVNKTFRVSKKGYKPIITVFDRNGYILHPVLNIKSTIIPFVYKEITSTFVTNKKKKDA